MFVLSPINGLRLVGPTRICKHFVPPGLFPTDMSLETDQVGSPTSYFKSSSMNFAPGTGF
jgi:hypothetical protein